MQEISQQSMPDPAELCTQLGITPLKRWGQNFLSNPNAIEEIAGHFPLDPECSALEIGPGLGHLSHAILKRGVSLFSLEIDSRMELSLSKLKTVFPKFSYKIDNALNQDWSELCTTNKRLYFFGNLPYNLSTDLFCKALLELPEAEGMAFLLQRETVDRLIAEPKSKEYGPSSILASMYGCARLGSRLKGAHFYPPPHVESRILFLEKTEESLLPKIDQIDAFFHFITASFSMRRKTLKNNLSAANICWQNKIQEDLMHLLQLRPEEILPEEWYLLYNNLIKD